MMSFTNSLRPSDAYMRQQTNHDWFRQWLVAMPAPSHYLYQCWNIVNWTLRKKFRWNRNGTLSNFKSGKCIWKRRLQNGVKSHTVVPSSGSITWTDQDADVSRVFKKYTFVVTTPSSKSHWITINVKLHVCTLWVATSNSDNKCDTSVMSLSAPLPLSLSRSHTLSLYILQYAGLRFGYHIPVIVYAQGNMPTLHQLFLNYICQCLACTRVLPT